jgi:hypothetical protein
MGKFLCCSCCSIIILEFQSGESVPADSLPQDCEVASSSSLFSALLHMIRPIALQRRRSFGSSVQMRDARCWGCGRVQYADTNASRWMGRGKGTVRMPLGALITEHSTDITPI